DNLVEMRHQDARWRTRAFARRVRTVTEAAQHAGLADAVIPVEVEVDAETAELLSPADFRDWSHRVLAAVHEPGSACPSLVRDVAWSTSFYARQASLRRLGQLAGAISFLGFVPYIIEIVQGKTRPNRATWWIWAVVGAMLCASSYASGARHALWVPLSYVIGPLATALLALKYGEGGWDR